MRVASLSFALAAFYTTLFTFIIHYTIVKLVWRS